MSPETRQNESALVCAARQGDKGALRILLMQNWAWLKALVYSIVCDSNDVDDILQDICVRLITKIGTLRELQERLDELEKRQEEMLERLPGGLEKQKSPDHKEPEKEKVGI